MEEVSDEHKDSFEDVSQESEEIYSEMFDLSEIRKDLEDYRQHEMSTF